MAKKPETLISAKDKLEANSAENTFPAEEADLPSSIPPAARDPNLTTQGKQGIPYDEGMVPEYSSRWEGMKAAYGLTAETLWSGRSNQKDELEAAKARGGKQISVGQFRELYPDVTPPSTPLLADVAAYRAKRFRETKAMERIASGAPGDGLQTALNVGASLAATVTDPREMAFIVGTSLALATGPAAITRAGIVGSRATKILRAIDKGRLASSSFGARLGYSALVEGTLDTAQGVVQEMGVRSLENELGGDYDVSQGLQNIALGTGIGFGLRTGIGEGYLAAKRSLQGRIGPTIDMNKAYPESVVKMNEINEARVFEGKKPLFDKQAASAIRELDVPDQVVTGEVRQHTPVRTGAAPDGTRIFVPTRGGSLADDSIDVLGDLGPGVHGTSPGVAHAAAVKSFGGENGKVLEIDISNKNVLSLDDVAPEGSREAVIFDEVKKMIYDEAEALEPKTMLQTWDDLVESVRNGDVDPVELEKVTTGLREAGYDLMATETKSYNGEAVSPHNTYKFLDESVIDNAVEHLPEDVAVKTHLESRNRSVDQWIDESENVSRDIDYETVKKIKDEMDKIDLNDADFGVEARKAVDETLEAVDELNKSGTISESVISRKELEALVKNRENVQIAFKALKSCYSVKGVPNVVK